MLVVGEGDGLNETNVGLVGAESIHEGLTENEAAGERINQRRYSRESEREEFTSRLNRTKFRREGTKDRTKAQKKRYRRCNQRKRSWPCSLESEKF